MRIYLADESISMVEPWLYRSTHTIQETCWWKVGTLAGNFCHKINTRDGNLFLRDLKITYAIDIVFILI